MLDLVLAVIFLVVAITGFRKGFLKSLIGLFGNFLALAGSLCANGARPTLMCASAFPQLPRLAGRWQSAKLPPATCLSTIRSISPLS